jgi:queuine tRNA-ribosyltransferase
VEGVGAETGLRVVNPGQAIFGIIQGSTYLELRDISLERLVEIGFDGYAIGGLSVGEEKGRLFEVTGHITPKMPEDRPRYLMGVGSPEDIVQAVALGVDMFDCVLPTRNARNGQLFTGHGRINIKNSRYKEDETPIDETCGCEVCSRSSKAYIRHLYLSGEILASILSTCHNVRFYLDTMLRIRQAITLGTFDEFRKSFLNDLALEQG